MVNLEFYVNRVRWILLVNTNRFKILLVEKFKEKLIFKKIIELFLINNCFTILIFIFKTLK